ncbi:hypothetical protein [Rhodospirillum centenum]|uniref:Uncharacterized protein n=1 Tax=Rhodospirillum centenum (strain ATCC 51521 / SW) TaxID=414684 RepID=B6IY71_RHOCS|nr:hypothetical protein [Rhodospirillum centenum]ACJ01245.1 conserved hypothetical protein [Rhodospirillum centenum SW]
MTETEFETMAACHGADIDRWPEREREPARQLLARSPTAVALLEREKALDMMLEALRLPPPPDAVERVVRGALAATLPDSPTGVLTDMLPAARDGTAGPPRPAVLPWMTAPVRRWPRAGLMAGALAAGLVLGIIRLDSRTATGSPALLFPPLTLTAMAGDVQ